MRLRSPIIRNGLINVQKVEVSMPVERGQTEERDEQGSTKGRVVNTTRFDFGV